jgi:hypothetical protein
MPPEDVALTQAAYIVIRLLQSFPTVKTPSSEIIELIGVEKQEMTNYVSLLGIWEPAT